MCGVAAFVDRGKGMMHKCYNLDHHDFTSDSHFAPHFNYSNHLIKCFSSNYIILQTQH